MFDVVIQSFISILALVITTIGGFAVKNYLIPFLNNKNLTFWVQQAVLAAEKYFNERPGLGKEKKEYVKKFLLQNLNVHVTDEQLDLLIDSTVESIINPVKTEPILIESTGVKSTPPQEELIVPSDINVNETPIEEKVVPNFIEDKDLVNKFSEEADTEK